MKLFNFFKKAKHEIEDLRKNEVVKDTLKTVNLGKTSILLTFDDGKKFTKVVMGRVFQHIDFGNNCSSISYPPAREPFVYEVSLISSETVATNYILNISPKENIYPNDDIQPTEAHLGKVKHAKILKTTKHEIEFQTYKVVEKKT